MRCRVGIYRGFLNTYSDEWINADHYSEKESLRTICRLMGYPKDNLFQGIVKPGNSIVVKPNWVIDKHPNELDIYSIITHSSILRAVVDLLYEALKGEGNIIISDAPQWDCDFSNLLYITQVQRISEYYWKKHRFEIPIYDLRQVRCLSQEGFALSRDRILLPGDPKGYVVTDIGLDSAFKEMPNNERLYGADYDRQETIQHHNKSTHEYLISKTLLEADVVVSVPKLKVHKKVGVTLNAKGMVGINGNKNWIAHFRIGPPSTGGDEFSDDETISAKTSSRLKRVLIENLLTSNSSGKERMFDLIYKTYTFIKPFLHNLIESQTSVDGGNWHGNDTAWRMAADLARIVLYADKDGIVRDKAQRRVFSVVDGIIGGEENGPLAPKPKPCGVVIIGDNLLAVDLVCTRLMGFDWEKVKSLWWLVNHSPQSMGIKSPKSDIEIISNVQNWSHLMQDEQIIDLAFKPHPNWQGYIEMKKMTDTIPNADI